MGFEERFLFEVGHTHSIEDSLAVGVVGLAVFVDRDQQVAQVTTALPVGYLLRGHFCVRVRGVVVAVEIGAPQEAHHGGHPVHWDGDVDGS